MAEPCGCPCADSKCHVVYSIRAPIHRHSVPQALEAPSLDCLQHLSWPCIFRLPPAAHTYALAPACPQLGAAINSEGGTLIVEDSIFIGNAVVGETCTPLDGLILIRDRTWPSRNNWHGLAVGCEWMVLSGIWGGQRQGRALVGRCSYPHIHLLALSSVEDQQPEAWHSPSRRTVAHGYARTREDSRVL